MAFNYDKLLDSFFVRSTEGRVAYHPWGSLGRGYWIDSEMRQVTLRAATRQYYRVMRIWLPIVLIGTPLLATWFPPLYFWTFSISANAGLYIWWTRVVARLTKDLERAPRKTWQGDFFRLDKAAARLSYPRLAIAAAFFSFLEVYAARDLFQSGRDWKAIAGDLLVCVINSYFVAILAVKLWRRIPTRATPQQQFMNVAMKPVWMWIAVLLLLSLFLAFTIAQRGR